jgi:hypothetical protein
MAFQHCDINTFLLIIIVILIIAFTDNIFKSFPIFKKLFTDQINYLLLIMLVILVILIDISSGIILAFLVLYLSVHINYNKKKVNFNDLNNNMINNKNNSINNNSINNSINNNSINNNINMQPSIQVPPNHSIDYSSESEFIYNNNKPFPNGNLKPFEPSHDNTTHLNENNKLSINSNIVNENAILDKDGFDVTGCRYDFKNNPQNLTKYGSPLARCSTYDADKAKLCGTVFYPLNA